jgi:hypothetical protein
MPRSREVGNYFRVGRTDGDRTEFWAQVRLLTEPDSNLSNTPAGWAENKRSNKGGQKCIVGE